MKEHWYQRWESLLCTAAIAALGLAPTLGSQAATPSISAGGGHSVALKADGTVRGWGSDVDGQLGDGRQLVFLSPVRVNGVSDVIAISAATQFNPHTVALKSDGTVWAWGINNSGQLGDGTTTDRATPSRVSGLTGVSAISAAENHTVALKSDGSVWAWGDNCCGQQGDGTTGNQRLTPAQVSGLTNVTAISAGIAHTIALKGDGTVWAWGRSGLGQFGATPIQVNGLTGVTAISAKTAHTIVLKSDGTVWAWGANFNGQLGDGTTTDRSVPVQVNGLTNVAAISAGDAHTVALKTDGTVWAWGYNLQGELGDGTTTQRLIPVRVSGLVGVAAICAGGTHTIALKSDGSLWTWGYNGYGQLGNGTMAGPLTPARVGLTGVVAISAGTYYTVVVKGDGSVWGFGSNESGQLGNGAVAQRTTPGEVSGLTGVTAISAGGAHTVALKGDGTVWTWGSNGQSQLGDGTDADRSTPVQVKGLTNASAIAGGGSHTVALKSDGTVWAWGLNLNGQVGDGTTIEWRSVPVQVSGLSNVIAVSAGQGHSVALKSDGTVWAWGQNSSGQLGDNTLTQRLTPVQVSGLTSVQAISAGGSHTVALKSDGTVWTWGSDLFGQLGIGSTDPRLTPFQVSGLTGMSAISAGQYHTATLKSDGTVWVWGFNRGGQLGDGTTTTRTSPVQLGGISSVIAVSAGSDHTLALKADDTVWAWGQNEYGHVGDGTVALRLKPVEVLRENGAGAISTNDWFLDLNPAITKIASQAPVFIVVTSGTGSNTTAQIEFRAQDIGTIGSTYVFALAPASIVKSAAAEKSAHLGHLVAGAEADTPIPCVLAQLNLTGQLQAVSASSLQAYVTGVLSAQGQSVTILNGVPAAVIDGATFFVGYGPDATQMLNNGVNRSVLSVPGSVSCQPQAPQTGWWWNTAEGGRGYSIEVQGNHLFYASYLYDISGRATWLVATGSTSLDGSVFTGNLYSFSGGQTLGGPSSGVLPPSQVAGAITLAFSDATHGTMIWPGGTVAIERFNIVPNGLTLAPGPNQPESGWWWDPQEPGRGFFLEWQGKQLFMAGYMYDNAGNPVWYLSGDGQPSSNLQSYSNAWQLYGNGQTLTGTYKPPTAVNPSVAPVTIQFKGANTGLMTLPNGRSTAIQRFLF
jgi:alpha-tubulin suppressor-like RCC1 family protein